MTWHLPEPQRVLFWSGAGISADAPTNGPLGVSLTHRAVDNYMSAGVRDALAKLYARLDVPNPDIRPRLETVLDALNDAYGLIGLRDVLSDLISPPPNANHVFFADHLLNGGRHVTANFDSCIERAASSSAATQGRLVHIHGSLDRQDALAKLGARLEVIENGFSLELLRALDAVLGAEDVTTIAFVGYSGSDFFDATPYLLSRLDALRTKELVWYEFARQALDLESARPPTSDLFAKLTRAGLAFRVVRGRLDEFLFQAGAKWPAAPHAAGAIAPARAWTPSITRSSEDRARATAALYARLGYRTGVVDAYDRRGPVTPRDWIRLADAYWGQGRYSEAMAAWEAAYSEDDEESRAHLADRRGAVLWIRGQLITAERRLWRAVNTWSGPTAPVSPNTSAAILETYGRVVQHMERLPDTRWLVRPRRVATAHEWLLATVARLPHDAGTELRVKTANVAFAFRHERDTDLEQHLERFAESDSLSSWLAYEHARLRARAEQEPPRDLAGLREDYERLRSRQQAIGATADAARTFLLPDSWHIYPPSRVRLAFAPVEMSRWNRWRLVGGFTVLWLLAHAKRTLRTLRRH